MTKKLCGFDVNGWRDFAARNWDVQSDGKEVIGPGPPVISSAGPVTSVVRMDLEDGDHWFGGRQADLAPHGLGGGWGAVGQPERRMTVRDTLGALHSGEGAGRQLAAAFRGLATGAAYNVVSLDDIAESTELLQERMLKALGTGRFRSPMLVWRPVLAALYAIEKGLAEGECTIGVICHAPMGVSVQKLRLRHPSDRSTEIIVPERRAAATHVPGDIGYDPLICRARERAVGPGGWSPRTEHRARARSVGRLALGLDPAPEIIRQANGQWDVIDLDTEAFLPETFLDDDIPDLGDCSVVLLETLCEGSIRRTLSAHVSAMVAPTVKTLPAKAVAFGALIAARRLSAGEPVYYDFLPQLSTIISGREGVGNVDLIDENDTIEAGRVYRSPNPAEFAIPANHPDVRVFLNKEGEAHPRKATVSLGTALSQPSKVSLWVEQKPAAGRARIILEAPDLNRHFVVDWDQAETDGRSWAEIITPPPPIPERLVLKCGRKRWEESRRGPGLIRLLRSVGDRDRIEWKTFADQLTARSYDKQQHAVYYCISSDGKVPPDVPPDCITQLDRLTQRALEETRGRLARPHIRRDNDALRFLTWQFRRCPAEVANWLIRCIKKRPSRGNNHPFILNSSSWTLIYQGLARIAGDPQTERRIMDLLLSSDLGKWGWRQETACIAILLSRSETAPEFLSRDGVRRLVDRNIREYEQSKGSEYDTFHYTPFLTAGLLRWRLEEPFGLLLGRDRLADRLVNAIDGVLADLKRERTYPLAQSGKKAKFEKKRERYMPILEDLKLKLEGQEGNPDLLMDIYVMASKTP